jgi:hypothetical protein
MDAHDLNMPLVWLMRKPLIVFISQDEHYAFRVFVHALGQGAYLREWEGHLQPRRGNPVAVALVACRLPSAHALPQRLLWRVRVMASPHDRADTERPPPYLFTAAGERPANAASRGPWTGGHPL